MNKIKNEIKKELTTIANEYGYGNDITLEDVDDTVISEILEEYADRTTSYDDELAFAAKGHGLSRPIHTWMDDALDEFNAICDSVK